VSKLPLNCGFAALFAAKLSFADFAFLHLLRLCCRFYGHERRRQSRELILNAAGKAQLFRK